MDGLVVKDPFRHAARQSRLTGSCAQTILLHRHGRVPAQESSGSSATATNSSDR